MNPLVVITNIMDRELTERREFLETNRGAKGARLWGILSNLLVHEPEEVEICTLLTTHAETDLYSVE